MRFGHGTIEDIAVAPRGNWEGEVIPRPDSTHRRPLRIGSVTCSRVGSTDGLLRLQSQIVQQCPVAAWLGYDQDCDQKRLGLGNVARRNDQGC